ncbi:unnamed protein product [Ectocarpus sp. 12 AP-2014]
MAKSPANGVVTPGRVQLFLASPQGQCITVRDVDLCTDDVSRLRQAWGASIYPGADGGCVSSDPPWLSSQRNIANRRRSSTDFDNNVGEDGGGDATIDADIRLVFAGKDLQRGRPLLGYGLQAESTVNVLGRLRGGAQLGKVVKGRSQVKKKGAEKPKEYAELQAKYAKMQEMDMARSQAIAAKAELRRRIDQEEKNSKMNRLKIQNQWRKIMRLAKVESLRKDIEILSQNHERDVDRKDAIIQMLDRDLEEAEDQFQTALRAHLQNMDQLIDLQDSRLLALEQEFEVELKTLQWEFAEERKHVVKQHAAELQELSDIIAAVEAQEEEREADAKQEHEQQREEIRNKNLEEINVLRITLDTQIEDLEQHFETAHINYLQNTDQRTTDFKYLTSKDQELSREIEVKIRKIERLQSSLQHWRTKIAQNVKENAERNSFLMEERNAIQGHFQHLKGRMNKFRAAQAKRLGELTQNANAVQNKLQEQLKMADQILTLAELARKAETEQEKARWHAFTSAATHRLEAFKLIKQVLPFYVSVNTDEVEEEAERILKAERDLIGGKKKPKGVGEEEAVAPSPLQSSAWGKNGQPVPRWNHLDNFHKRYNKANKLAVEREQNRLEAENRDLQSIVKQYLDGISVPEDVVSAPNPLLVVNGRVNMAAPDVGAGGGGEIRQIAAIEANHMVSTGRVNTRVGL